jgi:hypothetical protein
MVTKATYDRYLCGKSTSDIYSIYDPHPGP